MSKAEKKVVINVQFEFYPEKDDFFSKEYAELPDDKLVEEVEAMLDYELSSTNNDGLWWHFEKSKVVVKNKMEDEDE